MSRARGSLRDLVEAALLLVVGLGVVFLFLLTDFSSIQQSGNNLSRFLWALIHTAFPTSRFALYLEIVLAVIGGLSVGRVGIRAVVVGGFFLYFLINFITAWAQAPV